MAESKDSSFTKDVVVNVISKKIGEGVEGAVGGFVGKIVGGITEKVAGVSINMTAAAVKGVYDVASDAISAALTDDSGKSVNQKQPKSKRQKKVHNKASIVHTVCTDSNKKLLIGNIVFLLQSPSINLFSSLQNR